MSDQERLLKLVRDNIPAYVGADCVVEYKPMSWEEHNKQLRKKLVEEALEYMEDPTDEELADVLEVVKALARGWHGGFSYIEEEAAVKEQQRGGFYEGIGMYAVKT